MREGRDRVVTLATDRTGKILACHVSNGELCCRAVEEAVTDLEVISVKASQGFVCL